MPHVLIRGEGGEKRKEKGEEEKEKEKGGEEEEEGRGLLQLSQSRK